MKAIRSSETSVDARTTQRHIPEDDILHSYRCESLKSYILTYLSEKKATMENPTISINKNTRNNNKHHQNTTPSNLISNPNNSGALILISIQITF
jgi:hypothetical protein